MYSTQIGINICKFQYNWTVSHHGFHCPNDIYVELYFYGCAALMRLTTHHAAPLFNSKRSSISTAHLVSFSSPKLHHQLLKTTSPVFEIGKSVVAGCSRRKEAYIARFGMVITPLDNGIILVGLQYIGT